MNTVDAKLYRIGADDDRAANSVSRDSIFLGWLLTITLSTRRRAKSSSVRSKIIGSPRLSTTYEKYSRRRARASVPHGDFGHAARSTPTECPDSGCYCLEAPTKDVRRYPICLARR